MQTQIKLFTTNPQKDTKRFYTSPNRQMSYKGDQRL